MRLNLNKNVTRSSILWFNSKFRSYLDSDILTRFWLHFRANIDSQTYKSWTWFTYFGQSHFIDGKWIWTLTFNLNPTLKPYTIIEPKLDLNQFYESVLVPESFTLESKLTILPNPAFLCLIKILNNLTLRWFTMIDHLSRMSFTIGFCMILFNLGVTTMLTG